MKPRRNSHSCIRGHGIPRAISDSTPITVRATLKVGCQHTSAHVGLTPGTTLFYTPQSPRSSLRDSGVARHHGRLKADVLKVAIGMVFGIVALNATLTFAIIRIAVP